VRDIKEIKIFSLQTKNKQKKDFPFLDGWRQSKEGRERTFKFFCVCRVPIFLATTVDGGSVVPCSSV
jgi:hypothetical protein